MSRIKNVHLIGIGGCGMSAIARILFEMGYKVSGSDMKESSNTVRLKDYKIEIFYKHSDSNVRTADLVIYSSAITKDNIEIKEAESRSIPIVSRAEMLSWIMKQSQLSIGVAGTHGKTTTTSMISILYDKCGLNPTYLIGGERNDVLDNAKIGDGKYVVAEADESDGSFLILDPKVAIITNIEADHLDHYGTIDNIMSAFIEYANKIPSDGFIVICSDLNNTRLLLDKINSDKKIIKYGFDEGSDIRATNLSFCGFSSVFTVEYNGTKLGEVTLNIPGKQNISNCLAALAVGMQSGLEFTACATALASFTGTRRRFQTIGEINNILVVDDYAHHPTEISATLEAARLGWGSDRRVICVFQPHRYTRTMHLKDEFAGAFDLADIAIITDVYSAGEAPISGISGKSIVDCISVKPNLIIEYIPKKEKIADYLVSILKPKDILLTLGAGDIFTVGKEVLARLRESDRQLT